jgi:sugar lactone lactonase YvrE
MKNSLLLFYMALTLMFASCGKELISNGTVTSSTSTTTNVFAGNGSQGYINGIGAAAAFYNPTGLVSDASGNIYVADYNNNSIRKISPAGVVTTLAGNGTAWYADGPDTSANFNLPAGIAIDAQGNLYVADAANNAIRKISISGTVSTIAGSTAKGSANGTGTAATFSSPQGLAVDASGDVFVADNANNLIREITAAGVVTTLAGNGTQGATNGVDTAATFFEPTAIAIDASGNLYVADFGNNLIRKVTQAGKVTTLAGSGAAGFANGSGVAAAFNGPTGIALDASGNIYVADYGNNAIRIITAAGVVSTLNSNVTLNHPYGITVDASGNIYVTNYGNSTIQKISK